jgi:thymidylate synthase (FAD)
MQNTVNLIGFYGGDKEHAISAWTSTTRDYELKKDKMPSLLKMLADNGHETPFEKSTLHFLVDTDIATHIHLLKHRIGVSINAESARYKELKEDKFYLPEDWINIKLSDNSIPHKQDRELFGNNWLDVLRNYIEMGNRLYHQALEDLTPVLGRKRAKESARFFKTYNSQIQADISFNFRSFVHFQKLRNKPEAQVEVRELAEEMLRLVKELPEFEHSLKAFNIYE